MRIRILSDLHLEFADFRPPEVGADVVVLAGDIHVGTLGSNVRILERDAVTIGGVRFLGATLWTDMALLGDVPIAMAVAAATMTDFKLIRVSPKYRRLRPEDTVTFHHQARRWLEDELAAKEQPTVVITHHAPLPESLHPTYRGNRESAAYASDLRGLIEKAQPSLWIHGHVHHAHDYLVGATRVVCNPRGYPGEPAQGFRPDLVVTVRGV